MNWQTVELSWPAIAQNVQQQSEFVIHQLNSDSVRLLTTLESDANYGRHPFSRDAESLLGLRDELNQLLSEGTVLTVTPYQFQVGNQTETKRILDSKTAVKYLAQKLTDLADPHRPTGELQVIGVMLTATTLSRFASLLKNVTAVMPLPDWCQAARQAASLLVNDQEKMQQPAALIQPRFKPTASMAVNPFGDAFAALGSEVATLESLASDRINVIGKLQQLAQKRQSGLVQISETLQALKTMDMSVWSVSLSGKPASISQQLSNMDAPNHHQYTVASLLISTASMPFFEELLCSP